MNNNNIFIEEFNQAKHEKLWDEFVKKSVNGTIFHERRFINYHPIERFKDNSLIFTEKGKILAVFPAAVIEKENLKLLKSHPGTSYGGFVFSDNPGIKKSFDIINELERYSKENNFTKIEFRLCEKFFQRNQIDEIDFALLHNGFKREAEELSTFYDLTKIKPLSAKTIQHHFTQNTKQNLSQAKSNNQQARFLRRDEITEFHRILSSNLEKHSTKPVHSVDELDYLFRKYPNRVKIHGVFSDEELISAFLIFNVNSIGWHIFYSALDYEFAHLRPVNLGLFELLLYLKNTEAKYLNYGISTEHGGTIINWGLFRFKEGFSGESAIRTYWGKEIFG